MSTRKQVLREAYRKLSSIQVFSSRSVIQDSRENAEAKFMGRLNIARPSEINPAEMAVLASKETLHTLGPVPPSMTTRVIGKEINLGSTCNF